MHADDRRTVVGRRWLGATLKHMTEVGIRSLKQNASAVVAEAAAGGSITITDRGRPVAQLSALAPSALERLVATGRARRARRRLADLAAPTAAPARETSLSEVLADMRDERA